MSVQNGKETITEKSVRKETPAKGEHVITKKARGSKTGREWKKRNDKKHLAFNLPDDVLVHEE